MTTVRRYDRGTIRKARTDRETGFLHVDASVTKAPAVFEYQQPDGTVRREFRDVADVFSKANLDRLAKAEVTLDHPPVRVTTRNVRRYSVGTGDGSVRVEDEHAHVGLILKDEDAITAARNGKKETSCGYDCDLVLKSGVFVDAAGRRHPYDAIQKNHRNNHIAIVDAGRAGSTRLFLDRVDAVQVEPMPKDDVTPTPAPARREDFFFPADKDKARVRLSDKLDVELPIEAGKLVADALVERETAATAATAKADKAEAERDAAIKERDGLKEKADKLDVDALVEERLAVRTKAQPHFDDKEWQKLQAEPNGKIKRATVAKVHGDKYDEEKSDVYVDAAFDLIDDVKDERQTSGLDKLGNVVRRGDEPRDDDLDVRIDKAMRRDDKFWREKFPGGFTRDGFTDSTVRE